MNLTGQSLGHYHLLEKLGEGGMAIVYKAYDTQLEREVAVKIIRADNSVNEKFIKRFQREARALAKLNHPNIIPVVDYGNFEGTPFLVMPLVSGGTLKTILGKPLSYEKAAKLLTPVADALAYAHDQGIIHRDVKPSNILLDNQGKPMLSDFGVAKIIGAEETSELTGTGVGVGTPEYMAPEQALGKMTDGRADCYSLGIILYEMVTGRKPYQADTPLAIAIKQAQDPLPDPRNFVKGLPNQVVNLLIKCLAKNPANRYQSMHDMVKALQTISLGHLSPINEPVLFEENSSRGESKGKDQKRVNKPLLIGVASVLAVSIIVIGIIFPIPKKPTSPNNLATNTPISIVSPETATEEILDSTSPFKACLITAIGDNIEPGSFSGIGWQGVQQAVNEFGIVGDVKYPQYSKDLPGILIEFIQEGCSIIISSDYSEVEIMHTYAKGNPDVYFAMLECKLSGFPENERCGYFEIVNSSIIAGFLAAKYTNTGKIGTFGGLDLSSINNSIAGFSKGVEFYNFEMNTSYEVDGWRKEDSTSTHVYTMVDSQKVKASSLTLLKNGVDVIFPVAGSASKGALDAIVEYGKGYVIGVDSDWSVLYPEYSHFVLASVTKHFDWFVFESIKLAMEKKGFSTLYIGSLENGGTDLVLGKDFADTINNSDFTLDIAQTKAMLSLAKAANIDPLTVTFEQMNTFLMAQNPTPTPNK